MKATAYGWLMLAAIFVSLVFWWRLARKDERLVLIYVAALASAFIGAKLVYFGSEWWLHWHEADRWRQLATGKSIVGGLLGGYGGVEIAKRLLGYKRATGDWFAIIVPAGIVLGRIGCLVNGCCLGKICEPGWYTLADVHGQSRWPAVPVEILFNLGAIAFLFFLRQKEYLPGQHFHLYLMAYGIFRFGHEFLRDTPAVLGPFSGYQVGALAIFMLGLLGFLKRRQHPPELALA